MVGVVGSSPIAPTNKINGLQQFAVIRFLLLNLRGKPRGKPQLGFDLPTWDAMGSPALLPEAVCIDCPSIRTCRGGGGQHVFEGERIMVCRPGVGLMAMR